MVASVAGATGVGVIATTIGTGGGAGTVTGVVALPITVPPMTVTFAVNEPAAEYVHAALLAVVKSVATVLVSQSHTHEVTAGAPLKAVTVAVSVVGVPATTDVGDATTETL